MIKKSVFETELENGMQKNLAFSNDQQSAVNDLDKAIDNLHSTVEIFEDNNMHAQADQVLNLLLKIAKKHAVKKKAPVNKEKNSSKRYLKNLADHGTMLNDDNLSVDDGDENLNDLDYNFDDDDFEEE